PQARKKYAFLMRQFVDAMSPANFFWSNPAAVKQAMATGGASLARGLQNLAADSRKGIVSTSDERAFELGRDLATTPGAVIFENDYVQLIQYEPATPNVFERPLLIVPPCINKYYILDLQPANSFVQHGIAQGLTVFMVSWRNMPASMGHATWDDYLEHGVMEPIRVVRELSGCDQINALGFCVGGTLLASALAVLSARDEHPVASLTLLATLLDYSDTGDLAIYIDEAYVARRERELVGGGLLHGRELALAFASLRPNDLIWRYVVNNYLLGSTPDAFDLLHWNADSTNLPGPMYVYYLRNMYLENNLRQHDRLTMCGTRVGLSRLTMPAYVLATRGDHIVPWKTAYASAGLLGGRIDFVLAASGHIAGVINPPAPARRSFWAGDAPGPDPEEWLARASPHPGSWWPHWLRWLTPHAGASRPAATAVGSSRYPAIEPAPGGYVREEAEEQVHRT
ncbi:MAG TPA: alpha/beta fold hydrolase, partial [Burkholderiales bacterium]|nr:alpha/beta fold hydrolase [Burkholderiales bacterium]